MYNKHKNETIVYQVIIDNKTCISFNTEKKRSAFMKKVTAEGRRKITYLSQVIYPGRNAFVSINLAE